MYLHPQSTKYYITASKQSLRKNRGKFKHSCYIKNAEQALGGIAQWKGVYSGLNF